MDERVDSSASKREIVGRRPRQPMTLTILSPFVYVKSLLYLCLMGRTKGKVKYPKCSHPCGSKEYSRHYHLMFRYGIGIDDADKLLEEHNHSCAICKKHQVELDKPLAIDHCHESGKIRGVLCHNCNQALGKFFESKEILLSAIEYLENAK